MAVCAVVSLLTTPKPDSELVGLIWNKESLRLPVEQRATSRGLRNPTLWWVIIMGIVLFFYVRFPLSMGRANRRQSRICTPCEWQSRPRTLSVQFP
jgi:hypothetical protein